MTTSTCPKCKSEAIIPDDSEGCASTCTTCGLILVVDGGQFRKATVEDVHKWPDELKKQVAVEALAIRMMLRLSQKPILSIHCCKCGKTSDACLDIQQVIPRGIRIGDGGMCAYCGQLFWVQAEGKTRSMTDQEMTKLPEQVITKYKELSDQLKGNGVFVSSPKTPDGALTEEDHMRNAKACETMAEECYQQGDVMQANHYAFSKLQHERMAAAVAGKN